MAYIKGEDRNQIIMFPEAIDDYITEENAVRVIDSFVETLDLKALGFKRTGQNAVGHPKIY